MMTLAAATSPSTWHPVRSSTTPSARMLPQTLPKTSALFTSMSACITPCSPISSRSQLRTSPSNSPSILRVPATINVPRKFDPTPRTVFGAGGGPSFCRCRNRIIGLLLGLVPLEYGPCLEQSLEVLTAVVLELDRATLAALLDDDAGRESLLELRFDVGDLSGLGGSRSRVLAAHLPGDERLGSSDRESLGMHVASGCQLLRGVERQQGAGMSR